MTRRIVVLLVLALAVLATATTSAATASPRPHPRTTLNAVENDVMCVSCGVPLNIAESPQADRERAEIQRLVDRGLTKQQVKSELVAQYGPRVLAMPRSKGFGITAFAVPIAIALGAIALLAFLIPRWRRARENDRPAAGPVLSDADARRLDEDLARYDV